MPHTRTHARLASPFFESPPLSLYKCCKQLQKHNPPQSPTTSSQSQIQHRHPSPNTLSSLALPYLASSAAAASRPSSAVGCHPRNTPSLVHFAAVDAFNCWLHHTRCDGDPPGPLELNSANTTDGTHHHGEARFVHPCCQSSQPAPVQGIKCEGVVGYCVCTRAFITFRRAAAVQPRRSGVSLRNITCL